jgi:hypothetical protein
MALSRDAEGLDQGRWVRKQRDVYKGVHGGGRLTKRQWKKLVALPGWTWGLVPRSGSEVIARLWRFKGAKDTSRPQRDTSRMV